jgi:hypothetical protein
LAIVVPAWSLVLAFVAGLAVGVVACRLVMGRGRSAERAAPAAVTEVEPEAAAPERVPEAAEPVAVEPEPTPEREEDPAAAVDDVVAELERRVKGRRTDGEADRAAGGNGGRRG